MNHVTETQGGMAGENHTGLTELTAEVTVNAGVVLELVGLDQLDVNKHRETFKSSCQKNKYILGKLFKILNAFFFFN